MLNGKIIAPLSWTVVAAVLAFAPTAIAAADKTALVVVVNPKLPIQQISSRQLRDIYLGTRQTWDDGTHIVALTLNADAPERVAFDRIVLGMTTDEVARLWVDRRIRGQGGEPKAIGSVLLLQRVVAQTPGAIAYVRQDQLTDMVKALPVDAKKADEAGYPLVISPPQ